MYHDYPISPSQFHWESQSGTHEHTKVGMRYQKILKNSNQKAILFVREAKKDEHGRTMPFTCLGPCFYENHTGGRPMSITWNMKYSIPFSLFQTMKVAAG